jgi:hypothetical protein
MHIVVVVVVVALLCSFANAQEPLGRLRNKEAVFPVESIEELQESSDFLGLENEWNFRNLEDASLSFSMSMSMDTESCLPSDAMPFDVEASVDIGNVGNVEGETTRCGPNCYKLKGSGQDVCRQEDYFTSSSERSDAFHFAYTKATGPFVLSAKVCGTGTFDSVSNTYPRTGLMVRSSLDPIAQNFFLSHSPDLEANWSARRETNGQTKCDYDGSPDVPCLYLIIERFAVGDGDYELIGYYSYEVDFLDSVDTCNERQTIFEVAFDNVTFPDEVYVGMAVLYGKENELYESQFHEIHFANDNMFRDQPFTSRYKI